MNLPKLETPKYKLTIPSTGKKINFRPFLVKEEKILLLAQESENEDEILTATEDIVQNCTFNSIDLNKLTAADIEYIFLQLRAKSVGEELTIRYHCSNCNTINGVVINLEEIQTTKRETEEKIQLTDDVGLIMKELSYNDLQTISQLTRTDDIFTETLMRSINSIYDSNNTYAFDTDEARDESRDDLIEFIESLNSEQMQKIQAWIDDTPKVHQYIEFDCKDCGEHNEAFVSGLSNFFE